MRYIQKDLQGQLLKEEESRQAERAGRIRAERQLKVCKQQVSGSAADSSHETGSRTNLWIFKPLGELRSVFTHRHALAVLCVVRLHIFYAHLDVLADG